MRMAAGAVEPWSRGAVEPWSRGAVEQTSHGLCRADQRQNVVNNSGCTLQMDRRSYNSLEYGIGNNTKNV